MEGRHVNVAQFSQTAHAQARWHRLVAAQFGWDRRRSLGLDDTAR